MAVSAPTRVTGSKYEFATTTSSFTTDSFTAVSGRLYVALTSSESPAGTFGTSNGDVIAISQTHTGSWSWTKINQFYVPNASNWYERISVFYAVAPVTSTGTITFTSNDGSAPENQQTVIFIESVFEFTGMDQTSPVRQSKTGNSTSTSQALTLDSTPQPTSLIFGMIGDSFSGSSYTNIAPPSGWTEFTEDRAGDSGSINTETAYVRNTSSTGLTWTNVSGGFGSGAVALEIQPPKNRIQVNKLRPAIFKPGNRR